MAPKCPWLGDNACACRSGGCHLVHQGWADGPSGQTICAGTNCCRGGVGWGNEGGRSGVTAQSVTLGTRLLLLPEPVSSSARSR